MQHWYAMSDERPLLLTAMVLEIGHCRLLELAYQDWSGCVAREHDLACVFERYLFAGEVPYWPRGNQ